VRGFFVTTGELQQAGVVARADVLQSTTVGVRRRQTVPAGFWEGTVIEMPRHTPTESKWSALKLRRASEKKSNFLCQSRLHSY